MIQNHYMNNLPLNEIAQYVENTIGTFHHKRIESLHKLKLKTVLKKKNPYLFKAKSLYTANQIVRGLTDAFISSNEETVFGDWLEGLAIFINSNIYGGRKSGIVGIDLEFDNEGIRYIVTIKSGPNWGNSSQISKMRADFKTAMKTLRTSNSRLQIVAINGCCYGRDNSPDKGDYYKFCGQRFWEFISGMENLYVDLIEPIGNKAKERNDEFELLYASVINRFTREFIDDFCNENGFVDWEKLLMYNSKK